MSRVYVSLPLSKADAREVLRGAELANAGEFELVRLDASGEQRDALAVAHARTAIEDDGALAYIGGFHSSQAMAAAAVLGEAGMALIAPAATWSELHGPTLVRLMPDDRALARAIGHWLESAGVTRLLIVHDHDEGYGVPVARMCAEAVSAQVRSRPVWDWDEDMAADLGDAEAVLYVGVAGSGAVRLWDGLHALDERLWLLGTDGVARPSPAREMSAGAAARTRFFSTRHAPWGFYGYEALALVRDAGASDRAGVVAAVRATRDRDSVLGRYSLDEHGLTTSAAYAALEVRDGEIVWG
jgi:branched-chain amino acid transport system substrate-binding protein